MGRGEFFSLFGGRKVPKYQSIPGSIVPLAIYLSFPYIPAKYDFPKSSGLCCVTIGKRSPHVNNGPGLDGAGDAE